MNLVTMNLINATDQFMILGVRLISLFSLLIRPRNISCKDKFLKFLFFKTFQALPRSQQAFFLSEKYHVSSKSKRCLRFSVHPFVCS